MAAAIPLAVGLAAGVANNEAKQKEFERQRLLAANQEKWSPWTGVHGNTGFSKPSLVANALGGLAAGGSFYGSNPGLFGGAAGAAAPAAASMTGPTQQEAMQAGSYMQQAQPTLYDSSNKYGRSVYSNFT